jgi:hypothetical protein
MGKAIFRIRQRILRVISALIFTIIFFSCQKQNIEILSQTGVLKNWTGFDGCGWIIQLQDSTILEPLNLIDFALELAENKTIYFQYYEKPEMSICQVGKTVVIDCIEDNL